MSTATRTGPAEAPARSIRFPLSLRPATVLVAAAIVAVVSWMSVAFRAPWPIVAVLTVAALAVLVWASLSAIGRRSLVVAPLAVCLAVMGNPLTTAGLGSYVERHAGVITLSLRDGIVLWKAYPGIAGWEPSTPATQPVDTTGLAMDVQRVLRDVVGEMSDAYGYVWQVGDGQVGISIIANGFGGGSLFERVDAPLWQTSDFDGSPAQRATLVASTTASAEELGLTTVADPSGDVGSADGIRTWSGEAQRLTLTIDDSTVTLTYVGGPFLGSTTLPGEYLRGMQGFADLPLPPTIEEPNIPDIE
ncbi:hypothetical protein LG299_10685 [Microbacterium lacus]|uniref:hypothetical protein n=1 Tax=Microbacterium lacus TaxID=415217 RepID=UPI003850D17F